MCKAIELGRIVINNCLEHNYLLNTSKLQKLLYFMQKEFVRTNGVNPPLFEEAILATDCGPSIQEIRDYYFKYHMEFTQNDKQPIYIPLLDKEKVVVNRIIEMYGNETPLDMIRISKEESAWSEVWNNGQGKNSVIGLERLINN